MIYGIHNVYIDDQIFVEVIATRPRASAVKVERPEVAWDSEQYARLLVAAKSEGEEWVDGELPAR